MPYKATLKGRKLRTAAINRYARSPRGKAVNAIGARLRLYGITDSLFQAMFLGQCGKCAMCGVALDSETRGTTPHVDHNHKTNVNRGLLCARCNAGLGFIEDQVFMARAVTYLGEG